MIRFASNVAAAATDAFRAVERIDHRGTISIVPRKAAVRINGPSAKPRATCSIADDGGVDGWMAWNSRRSTAYAKVPNPEIGDEIGRASCRERVCQYV